MNILLGPATPQQQRNSFFPLLTFKEQVHKERVDIANLWPNINWHRAIHFDVHQPIKRKPNLSTLGEMGLLSIKGGNNILRDMELFSRKILPLHCEG
jgi:hypothetical protein